MGIVLATLLFHLIQNNSTNFTISQKNNVLKLLVFQYLRNNCFVQLL